ncbi:MAG: BrnT family toxin [Candidatus Taylorbacteria bacterium]|nr:BrnT family toxin [Candidatus Taylorbacteria bacterium]
MKYFDWDPAKNDWLKQKRGVSFEEVLIAIEEGDILDIVRHPRKSKYPHQRIFIIRLYDYAHLVPFAEDEEKIFLKTIIPSRRATKKYIQKHL